ncbi:MAG: hypothetical protein V7749_09955 [Cocleimonas sp.]
MLSQTKFPILAIMFSISACDSKIENPLAGQIEALEKANNVEKQLLEAQQRAEEAIDKASQ